MNMLKFHARVALAMWLTSAVIHAPADADQLSFALSSRDVDASAMGSGRRDLAEEQVPPQCLELSYARLVADIEDEEQKQDDPTIFEEDEPYTEADSVDELAELNRKLENPLSDVWAIVFQNNTSLVNGDAVSGTKTQNLFFFQPFLPFPVGANQEYMLALRPVFPILTSPVLDPTSRNGTDGRECGFGDIQLLTLFGPNKSSGWVWGAGATFKFPTASDDALGIDKYQAGPAGMILYTRKPWTLGIIGQHWWSYAGDGDERETSESEIQYVARYNFYKAMTIGMGPSVKIDWRADSDNHLEFPIGLGLTDMIRIGKVPVKIRFETQYSVIQPNDYGTEWNFRIQIVPVIQNPFR
jgi:hypothetical protein